MRVSQKGVNAARVWLNLNYVRHALVLVAWIAAVQTFALAQTVRRHITADSVRHRREA